MIVEDERYASIDHIYNTSAQLTQIEPYNRWQADFSIFAQNQSDIRNTAAHYQLQNDLIAHLWARKGRDNAWGTKENEDL
jgi:hypothetical protein